MVENRLSPGELSTFVIYAVYVGSNVGQLAGVVSSLVQVYHASALCPALPFPNQLPILSQRLPSSLLASVLLHWVLVAAQPRDTGCSRGQLLCCSLQPAHPDRTFIRSVTMCLPLGSGTCSPE